MSELGDFIARLEHADGRSLALAPWQERMLERWEALGDGEVPPMPSSRPAEVREYLKMHYGVAPL